MSMIKFAGNIGSMSVSNVNTRYGKKSVLNLSISEHKEDGSTKWYKTAFWNKDDIEAINANCSVGTFVEVEGDENVETRTYNGKNYTDNVIRNPKMRKLTSHKAERRFSFEADDSNIEVKKTTKIEAKAAPKMEAKVSQEKRDELKVPAGMTEVDPFDEIPW